MTAKSLDRNGRWRSITIGFRVSPEENERINKLVALSGMPKQHYIRMKLEDETIIVTPNPRMYKGVRNTLSEILNELKRLENNQTPNKELIEIIESVANVLGDMKGEI